MRFGVGQARRGWLGSEDVLNTGGLKELLKRLKIEIKKKKEDCSMFTVIVRCFRLLPHSDSSFQQRRSFSSRHRSGKIFCRNRGS